MKQIRQDMKHLISTMTIILAIVASYIGCDTPPRPLTKEKNSVYYWKTVLRLDSAELSFLRRHDIARVYLRMFDVSAETQAVKMDERTVPNASVRVDAPEYNLLKDSLNDIEFVPVVYITLDALKAMAGHEGLLASNIVTRVRNMVQYNSLPNVSELQLDCDWTVSTETSFFCLCDSVRRSITNLQLPWRLSSTIRLHQLSRKSPPVDRGVLMVYNTGCFNSPDAANSIIDAKDVRPYLRHLSGYPLHLDVAYPTYSWQLLFRKRQFIGLIRGMDTSDTTRFIRQGGNVYMVRRDIPYNGMKISVGDMIREEKSAFRDIAAVKRMIEAQLSGTRHSNILYHFDLENLSKYSSDEIEYILSLRH